MIFIKEFDFTNQSMYLKENWQNNIWTQIEILFIVPWPIWHNPYFISISPQASD